MIDDLYSTAILSLAANVPRLGGLVAPDAAAERVSKVCGSRVRVEVKLEGDRVADFAQEVRACALGQAAAAILGNEVVGARQSELESARDALRDLLDGRDVSVEGRFSALTILKPIKDFPARHASTLLAFEAAVDAVRAAVAERAARSD